MNKIGDCQGQAGTQKDGSYQFFLPLTLMMWVTCWRSYPFMKLNTHVTGEKLKEDPGKGRTVAGLILPHADKLSQQKRTFCVNYRILVIHFPSLNLVQECLLCYTVIRSIYRKAFWVM